MKKFIVLMLGMLMASLFTSCNGDDDGGSPNYDSGYICFKADNVPQTFGLDVDVFGMICTKNEEGEEICTSGELTQLESERVECFKFQDGAQPNVTLKVASSCFKEMDMNVSLKERPLPLDLERDPGVVCFVGEDSQYYEQCNQYFPSTIAELQASKDACIEACYFAPTADEIVACLNLCDDQYVEAVTKSQEDHNNFTDCCEDATLALMQVDQICSQ